MTDDTKPVQLLAPVKDKRDYYTKLWENTRGKGNPMERVRVLVRRGSAILGKEVVLLVQVYSTMLPGRIKQGEKVFDMRDDSRSMRQAAGVLAGALAEQCCDTFGDIFDPSEYARMGVEAFDQFLKNLNQNPKSGLTQGLIIQ